MFSVRERIRLVDTLHRIASYYTVHSTNIEESNPSESNSQMSWIFAKKTLGFLNGDQLRNRNRCLATPPTTRHEEFLIPALLLLLLLLGSLVEQRARRNGMGWNGIVDLIKRLLCLFYFFSFLEDFCFC